MAQAAGVVKGLIGGGATVINNITGETRTLNIGDIVYQNEKITTNDTDTKLTITQNDGKDITLIGKDILMLDQSTSSNEGFGNKTVADTTALQQAILTGTDLNALEETAAGGASGGEGVSLSEALFLQGGHTSNVNANVGNIDALAASTASADNFGINNLEDLNAANQALPPLPEGL